MQVLCFLHSLTLGNIPQCAFLKKPPLSSRTARLSNNNNGRCPDGRMLKASDFRVLASGTVKSSSMAVEATTSDVDAKDDNLVFVAGATGRVGSRTVRELLKLGFKVRAGIRSAQRAESLVQSVQRLKLDNAATVLTQPIERLEIVECDLENKAQIGPALGNSLIIICCIGASEKEVFDVTGPYRIDYLATKNLIDAAIVAKVGYFILLTSLGTNKIGFPAAILNLFWGVLIWKRKAEEALLASGLPYTIVRPGGMERPTDAYKETHNITLSPEDTLFGGQVSNLQVAELIAFMAKNRSLSCCKVVEVIAETTAPLTPLGELLTKIPSPVDVNTCKELGDVDERGTAVSESFTSKTPSTSVEKEPITTPLSPYIAYEDLKPPTSPTPTPSSGSVAISASGARMIQSATASPPPVEAYSSELLSTTMEEKKRNSSSPYTSYDDLKAPSTPTPNPPTASSKDSLITGAVSGDSRTDTEAGKTIRTPLSPYAMYDNLKPPSSPSPNPSGPKQELSSASASNGDSAQLTGGNNVSGTRYANVKPPTSPAPNAPAPSTSSKVQPTSADKVYNTQQHTEVKTTPLSPYTMYENMKPPSSPMPSLKKL